MVLGGRLGYVLFYKPGFYLEHPQEIVFLWQGGMSFHGGFLGVVVATILFARKQKIPVFAMSDIIAGAAPIGCCSGDSPTSSTASCSAGRPTCRGAWSSRLAADAAPSEPALRGPARSLVLFFVLHVLIRRGWLRRPWFLTGAFLIGYGVARIVAELFREPDAHLGFIAGGVTMGQILSLPMLLAGIGIVFWARRAQP